MRISRDEWYPVYCVDPERGIISDLHTTMTDKEYAEYLRVMAEMETLQEKLYVKWQAAEKEKKRFEKALAEGKMSAFNFETNKYEPLEDA